jgi:hypothetical protein
MIYRLHIAGTLEDFWRNHSVIDDLPHQLNNSFPVTEVDESLAQAINIVITQLGELGAGESENSHNFVRSEPSPGELWSGAISSINRQIKIRDALAVERDVLVVQRDVLVVQRDVLAVERDAQITVLAPESAVDEYRQENIKLTSSKAFRMGMFITWPARHLRSAIATLKRCV